MHEMSLCEGILQIINTEAKKQGFKQVKTIWLEIGELSHIQPEALLFCFDVVNQNSLAENAELKIINIPGEALCMECGTSVTVKQYFDECSNCGSFQLTITGGNEMKIKDLEVV